MARPGGLHLLKGLAAIMTLAAVASLVAEAAPRRAQDLDYERLWDRSVTFAEFLEDADRRRDAWHDHYENGAPTHQALQEARAVGGEMRFLVVAEDWCGDSVNTVPYLARLVEQVDGWEMRVINSRRGADVMSAHPTPDGRSATPTVVLLGDDWAERGAWVERPSVLQEWFLEYEDELERQDLMDQKYRWYAEDAGEETVREITELVRAAVAGDDAR